jgi:hypothetical protein
MTCEKSPDKCAGCDDLVNTVRGPMCPDVAGESIVVKPVRALVRMCYEDGE